MISKRLLQNALTQSMRYSVQRSLITAAPVAALRSSTILNRNAFSIPARNSLFEQRQYNTKAEPSLFQVVDYNDIQSIIKDNGKVNCIYAVKNMLINIEKIELQLD